jgi:hypothetical protein
MILTKTFRWEILSLQNGTKSLIAYTLRDDLLSPVGSYKWKIESKCYGNNWTVIDIKLSQVKFIEKLFMREFIFEPKNLMQFLVLIHNKPFQ